MTVASPFRYSVWEDTGHSLMARIIGDDAANIQQSDISSIAYSVFDLSDTATVVTSGSLTVSNVIFDTLQTDARWDADSTGYNFRWDIPASLFPTGGKDYRIEIAFTPTGGEVFHVVAEANAQALHRS
mgnify:CR=1 FL=1